MDAALLFIGSTDTGHPEVDVSLIQRVTQYVEAEALGSRVLFVERSDDVASYLSASDVFVLPSAREGHPKTLVEAMACGLAVVGTDAPGIRDVIVSGETGLLVENDRVAFREAIARLLADGDRRARLGRHARDYAREHFSFARVLEAEMTFLSEIAEGQSGVA